MAISLLPLYDGETLENNFARYVKYNGLTLNQKLRQRIFGYQSREGTRFPCGISHLAEQARDYWNLEADQIIEKHTEFNYITMMASSELRSEIRAGMKSSHVDGTWKLRFRFSFERDSRPRYCRECLTGWVSRRILPYCRISHQLPGVYYCDIHLTRLMVANGSSSCGVPASMLAPLIHKSDVTVLEDLNSAEERAIKSVAINSARQQRDGGGREGKQYFRLLNDAGLIAPNGYLRMTELVTECRAFFGQSYCHSSGLDEQKIFDWWRFVNRSSKTRSLHHPFVFLAVQSLAEFRILSPDTHVPVIPKHRLDVPRSLLPKCKGALHRDSDSYGAIRWSKDMSRRFVSCSCGMRYMFVADSGDIDASMVPSGYGERYKQRFDKLLATGCSTADAAREIGISTTTAVEWERERTRRDVCPTKKHTSHIDIEALRRCWGELVLAAPPQGRISAAFRERPAIYRKLIKYDHDWLINFNRRNRGLHTPWIYGSKYELTEARKQTVQQAYDELMHVEPPVHITRTAIARQARLPLSVRDKGSWSEAFSNFSETYSAYVDRSLSWVCALAEPLRPRNRHELARLIHVNWSSLNDRQKLRTQNCILSEKSRRRMKLAG
ncbi:UNVERIFIED_ORG: TniQ protein [Burkholderia sp. CF145]